MFLIVMGAFFLIAGGGMLYVVHSGVVSTLGAFGVAVHGNANLGLNITGGVFVGVGVILVFVGIALRRSWAARQRLLSTGIPGTATITGLEQTGVSVGSGGMTQRPQIIMDLTVSVQGRPPYSVRHSEFVPILYLGRLTQGAPLTVRVDPANPNRLAVDWSRSIFQSGT